MKPDIIYREALYLGSIPLDTDSSSRADFVRNKLESLQSFSWCKPVMLCISTSGVKVCDPTCKTIFMAHALRRISYATSDISSPKFVFLAREANVESPSQFCHIFATDNQSRAEELNRIMGDAFRLAFEKQRLAKQPNCTVADDDSLGGSEKGDLPTLSSLHDPTIEPNLYLTEADDLCDLNLPPPPSSPPPPFEEEVEVNSVPPCHINGNTPDCLQAKSHYQNLLLARNCLGSDESDTKPPTFTQTNATTTSSSDGSGSQKQKKHANVRHGLAINQTPPATRGSAFFTSSSTSNHRPSTNAVFDLHLADIATSTTCPVVALKAHLDGLALKEQPAPPPRPKTVETPSRFRLRGPRTRDGRETTAAEIQKARRSMLLARGDRPLSQIICLDSALLLNNSPSFASQPQPRSEEQLIPSDAQSSGGGSQVNEFFADDSATSSVGINSLQNMSDNNCFQDSQESKLCRSRVRKLAEICPVPHLPSVVSDSILLPPNNSLLFDHPPEVANYSSSTVFQSGVDVRQINNRSNCININEKDREPWRPSHTSAFTNATGNRKNKRISQLPSHAFPDSVDMSSTIGGHRSNGWHQLDSISHPRFPVDSESVRLNRLQKQLPERNSAAATKYPPPSSSTETPTPTATPTPTPTPTPGAFIARKDDVVGSVYHTPWFQAFLPRDVALELLSHEEAGAFLVRDSVTHPGCWALSVRVPEHVNCVGITHYLIQHSQHGVKLKGLDKEWPSLEALITHLTVMPEMLPCPLRMSSFSSNPSFGHNELDVVEDALPPRTTSALSPFCFPPPPPSSSSARLLHSSMASTGVADAEECFRFAGMNDSLIFEEGGTLNGPSRLPAADVMEGGEEYQRLSDFSSMLADMQPAAVYR